MKKKVGLVLLAIVVLVIGFLYFPRGSSVSASQAATVAVLHSDIQAQRSGADFGPALDGEVLASGDVVRSSDQGRAVLTFFDGSLLTIDPGSQVKVTSLARTAGGGLQVSIEQTLGRTWASVQKLKTPDSKFELKTPSSTAVVRGTSFETVVEKLPDGKIVVTYKTSEGEVLVQAVAGGQTTVPAGTQVSVQQDQPAPPAPQPQPPNTPRLDVTASAGIGVTISGPSGYLCGAVAQQIPGCVLSGQKLSITNPAAGRYGVVLTAAAATNATLTAEAFRGTTRDAVQTLTRSLSLGDLVRSGITLGVGATLTLSAFEEPQQVTSVCGATATGRVFSSGPVADRTALARTYAQANKNQPAAVVVIDRELTQAAADAVATISGPATISNVQITIDGAGLHLAAQAAAGPFTVPVSGDIVAGAVNGKLVMRVRNISAGPLPQAVVDQVVANIESALADFTNSFPLVTTQVAFRSGCMAIIGTTPP